MYYGKEKSFQMSKSLLPSTMRRYAKWKRSSIHRETRRHNKQVLTDQNNHMYYDDDWNFDDQVHHINELKYERRNGDKIHPFIEWSKAITKTMPKENRLSYVKSLLPKSVIGDHALGHLKFEDHFLTPAQEFAQSFRYNYSKRYLQKPEKQYDLNALLYDILAYGYHTEFNEYMHKIHRIDIVTKYRIEHQIIIDPIKGRTVVVKSIPIQTDITPVRLLLGFHDIDKFVEDVSPDYRKTRTANMHTEWKAGIYQLIKRYEKYHRNWYKAFNEQG